MSSASVTGIVLAGGRGARLGGADKGLQRYRGRPLVEYMLDCLLPVVATVVISANRNLDVYRTYRHAVVSDAANDFAGPLAGLLASLTAVTTDYALVLPCDMPLLGSSVPARLLDALQCRHEQLLLAADPLRQHYSVFACRTEPALVSLRSAWDDGVRSLRGWQQRLDCGVVTFADTKLFLNCNTSDMLRG